MKRTFEEVLDEIQNDSRHGALLEANTRSLQRVVMEVAGARSSPQARTLGVYMESDAGEGWCLERSLEGAIAALEAEIGRGGHSVKGLQQLRRAFALAWHPDRFVDAEERESATRAMQRVNLIIDSATGKCCPR